MNKQQVLELINPLSSPASEQSSRTEVGEVVDHLDDAIATRHPLIAEAIYWQNLYVSHSEDSAKMAEQN